MPYTLAHPAAILPLRRFHWLSSLGLVVGAMSPDFEHVLRVTPVSRYSHTLMGLLWFCLPVGLLVMWAYRFLWRVPLSKFFPQPIETSTLWKDGLSVLIGALTHITWDSFTHRQGLGVK